MRHPAHRKCEYSAVSCCGAVVFGWRVYPVIGVLGLPYCMALFPYAPITGFPNLSVFASFLSLADFAQVVVSVEAPMTLYVRLG